MASPPHDESMYPIAVLVYALARVLLHAVFHCASGGVRVLAL